MKPIRCACCQRDKAPWDFYPQHRRQRLPRCSICHNNRHNHRLPCLHIVSRRCPRCCVVKPLKDFPASCKTGRLRPCFACEPEVLPESRDSGAPICPACHQAFRHDTDWLGRSLQVCVCGTMLLPLKVLGEFHRYEATEQRLKHLAATVGHQQQPAPEDWVAGAKMRDFTIGPSWGDL